MKSCKKDLKNSFKKEINWYFKLLCAQTSRKHQIPIKNKLKMKKTLKRLLLENPKLIKQELNLHLYIYCIEFLTRK